MFLADLLCSASAKMAISNFQLVCAVVVVAIATFVNLPAPRFSKRLEEWRNMGQYFNYRGNAIFYQGNLQYWREYLCQLNWFNLIQTNQNFEGLNDQRFSPRKIPSVACLREIKVTFIL